MKENLAAINVVCNGKLVNRNSVPLLFYWNGETDLLEDIKSNIDFGYSVRLLHFPIKHTK